MNNLTKSDKESEHSTTLADLPVGSCATIFKIIPNFRGKKKFADIGLVPGAALAMQAHAPFGGLIRIKVMQTSIAIHSLDAKNIILYRGSAQ